MIRVCFGEMFPRRVSDNKLREIPRKGANHGLQETPDGREILREEVLRRRLPVEHARLERMSFQQQQLPHRQTELIGDHRPG